MQGSVRGPEKTASPGPASSPVAGSTSVAFPSIIQVMAQNGVAGKRFRRCAGGKGAAPMVLRTSQARTQEANATRGATRRATVGGQMTSGGVMPAL